MPIMSEYTKPEADTDIAAHAALTATHGVAGTIASIANIVTHAALTTDVHGVGTDTIGKVASFAKTETRNVAASDGNIAYTGYGFKPSALIVFAGISGVVASISLGFADRNKVGLCLHIQSPPTPYLYAELAHCGVSASTVDAANVVSYDDDGFTLSWTKTGSPTGTATLQIIAFK